MREDIDAIARILMEWDRRYFAADEGDDRITVCNEAEEVLPEFAFKVFNEAADDRFKSLKQIRARLIKELLNE